MRYYRSMATDDPLHRLRGTVLRYDDQLGPVWPDAAPAPAVPPSVLAAASPALQPHLPALWTHDILVFGDPAKAEHWLLKRDHLLLPATTLTELLIRIDHGIGA